MIGRQNPCPAPRRNRPADRTISPSRAATAAYLAHPSTKPAATTPATWPTRSRPALPLPRRLHQHPSTTSCARPSRRARRSTSTPHDGGDVETLHTDAGRWRADHARRQGANHLLHLGFACSRSAATRAARASAFGWPIACA